MAQEFAKKFYKSKAWQQCRDSYIQSVFGVCERCGKPGYIVHHKIKLTANNIDNPTVSLNHNNLEYLCLDCHNNEHMAKTKRYKFDSDGMLLPPINPHK